MPSREGIHAPRHGPQLITQGQTCIAGWTQRVTEKVRNVSIQFPGGLESLSLEIARHLAERAGCLPGAVLDSRNMDNFSLTGQPLINEFNPVVDSPGFYCRRYACYLRFCGRR